ncbi:MAG: hypothetical protein AB2L12_03615 [Smithellaceae bacterium]
MFSLFSGYWYLSGKFTELSSMDWLGTKYFG